MSEENIIFTINDQEVKAEQGQTVLQIARKVDIWIPTLCYHQPMEAEGSCRLCLVEVEAMGRRRLATSCGYPVAPDIKVYTDTPKVIESRKVVAELLLARCSENKQIRELCEKLGVSETPFSKDKKDCMLCGLCVQMCNKRMQVGAIGFVGRGYERKVGTPYDRNSDVCITCGACEFICPTGAITATMNSGREPVRHKKVFEQGLSACGNIDIPFPSAVPLLPSIDRTNCIHFNVGKDSCKICSEICPANAITYEQEDVETEIEVGAVIMSPGLEKYDPKVRGELGYGRWPNVVTSLQFERILSASGPFQGTVTRPGDGKHPVKIAWIQCVGSRDQHNANPWCSSVCCMYATKQAVIAKEHDKSIQPTIFYMEMRAYGKDFDKYVERAKNEYGVRYMRSMISAIREEAGTGNLRMRYSLEDGSLMEEMFDLVVLSIGFEPHRDAAKLAEICGIDMSSYLFPKTSTFEPVDTSRPGVYVTGTFQGPKDIPETVIQGSAVAGQAMALLGEARWTETLKKELPPERDIRGEEPKIGVFVCSCGINIAATVDVAKVVDAVKDIPGVAHAENTMYTCSQDSQEKIKQVIQEKGLNRVLVASCTPRTHAPLFQETIREAGLNKYLFELADIREQCSWCHMGQREEATKKAIRLTKMMIAKVKLLQPIAAETVGVTPASLIVGGGVAGMTAALSLADQGFDVHIVEREKELGGLIRNLYYTQDGSDIQNFLKARVAQVTSHPKIKVHTGVEVQNTDGFVGNFKTLLTDGTTFDHGAIILATGGVEYQPTEYLYEESDRIITQRELEKKIFDGLQPAPGERYVMIQCVGSREEPNQYCSRVCCQDAVKNAIEIKERNPKSQVVILYRDIRTYGLREDYYTKARDLGVLFVRYDVDKKPQVEKYGDRLKIRTFDFMLNKEISMDADWVVLSTGLRPHPTTEKVGQLYKVTRNPDGYFLEAHVKLRPVDFPSEGIFVAGLAHAPKNLDETISQALASAGRAGVVLSHERLAISGLIAKHKRDLCMSCLSCFRICPFGSPFIDEDGKVSHNEIKCHGCGLCAGICPAKAFQINGFSDEQMLAMIDSAAECEEGGVIN
ncbi:MAG TPA: 4Fe-4S binding protein [Dissulfurispiraceae bacterium]|nr:4Fe-4S binding protein [Dissulfurispiraceae bacterium]